MPLRRSQASVKIDWDKKRRPNIQRIEALITRAGYRVIGSAVRKSPSGNGWHVVLSLRPYPKSPFEVVALQAICGGDPWREAMQMQRAQSFDKVPVWMRDRWNVLYVAHRHRRKHVTLPEL